MLGHVVVVVYEISGHVSNSFFEMPKHRQTCLSLQCSTLYMVCQPQVASVLPCGDPATCQPLHECARSTINLPASAHARGPLRYSAQRGCYALHCTGIWAKKYPAQPKPCGVGWLTSYAALADRFTLALTACALAALLSGCKSVP
jgi:hypothetical protein